MAWRNMSYEACEDQNSQDNSMLLYNALESSSTQNFTIRHLNYIQLRLETCMRNFRVTGDEKYVLSISGSEEEGAQISKANMKDEIPEIEKFCSDKDAMCFPIGAEIESKGTLNDPDNSECYVFKMDSSNTKAGYTKLKLVARPSLQINRDKIYEESLKDDQYLSSTRFLQLISEPAESKLPGVPEEIKGPSICISGDTIHKQVDHIHSFLVSEWPEGVASSWIQRGEKCSWLPVSDRETVCRTNPCLFLVPVGHCLSQEKDLEWRLSFSSIEGLLINRFNSTQLYCFFLLKVLIKEFITSFVSKFEKPIKSYFIKTLMFWALEDFTFNWTPNNLLQCMKYALEMLYQAIKEDNLPHFFIPKNNILEGKLNEIGRKELLKNLEPVLSIDHIASCLLRKSKILPYCDVEINSLDIQYQKLIKPARVAFLGVLWELEIGLKSVAIHSTYNIKRTQSVLANAGTSKDKKKKLCETILKNQFIDISSVTELCENYREHNKGCAMAAIYCREKRDGNTVPAIIEMAITHLKSPKLINSLHSQVKLCLAYFAKDDIFSCYKLLQDVKTKSIRPLDDPKLTEICKEMFGKSHEEICRKFASWFEILTKGLYVTEIPFSIDEYNYLLPVLQFELLEKLRDTEALKVDNVLHISWHPYSLAILLEFMCYVHVYNRDAILKLFDEFPEHEEIVFKHQSFYHMQYNLIVWFSCYCSKVFKSKTWYKFAILYCLHIFEHFEPHHLRFHFGIMFSHCWIRHVLGAIQQA